jgi:beta-phosphoglucomutase family hydrolase
MGNAEPDKANWAVIFDVDGTMVDNARFHQNAWIELGRRHNLGIDIKFYREKIHSKSNDKNVRLLFKNADDDLVSRISHEKETIYRNSYRPYICEIAGLRQLLDDIKANNVPCAAASNSPAGNVDMVLDELDIRQYFDAIVSRDQVNTGKPNPELFLTAAEKMGITPNKCVVLEDSVSGFKAANNAGMSLIAITCGSDPDDLEDLKLANGIFPDFTKLNCEILNQHL